MFGYDFLIYYEAAQALLAGMSPYQVPGFFSPITLAILFMPLALFRAEVAMGIWVVVNLGCLVILTRRKALLAILFVPLAFLVYVGQVDLLVLTLGMLGGWPGLVLSTVKPQLAVWLWAYWLWVSPQKIKFALPVTVLIHVFLQLVHPWVGAWMSATPGVFTYASRSASIFGLSAVLGPVAYPIALGWFAQALSWVNRDAFFRFMAVFNPISSIYSHVILVREVTVYWVALSWLLIPVSLYLHTAAPFILIPIGMAIKDLYTKQQSNS